MSKKWSVSGSLLIKCSKCRMFGHSEDQCRKGIIREWVRKEVQQAPVAETQPTQRQNRVAHQHAAVPQGNTFEVLGQIQEGREHDQPVENNTQNGEGIGDTIYALEHG